MLMENICIALCYLNFIQNLLRASHSNNNLLIAELLRISYVYIRSRIVVYSYKERDILMD